MSETVEIIIDKEKNMTALLDDVCAETRMTPAILRGASQRAAYVDARRLFIWRAHKELGQSLEAIAWFLMRDRTTIAHHMRLMDNDATITECRATIKRMSRAKPCRIEMGARNV